MKKNIRPISCSSVSLFSGGLVAILTLQCLSLTGMAAATGGSATVPKPVQAAPSTSGTGEHSSDPLAPAIASSENKADQSSLMPAAANAKSAHDAQIEADGELINSADDQLGKYLDKQRRGHEKKRHEKSEPVPFPVLKPSEEFVENENVADPDGSIPKDPGLRWELREYQIQLRVARELRLGENLDQAIINLVQLMDSRAPEEIKSEALFELGIAAQQKENLVRAQQIFSHLIARFPRNPNIPEATLRQGIIHQQMGAHTLALSKFYAVLSSSLKLGKEHYDHYKLMVLKAQTEIADTYYISGEFKSATDFYDRLLELDSVLLNKPLILYKLIRCLGYQERYTEVIARSESFIRQYPDADEHPEIRFIFANTLKKLGRNADALEQVLQLLESERSRGGKDPDRWIYWQQRTGNEIGNQLYREGDYMSAMEIYVNLSSLSGSPQWQLPIWYQMGLIYEKLEQPAMGVEVYTRIVDRTKELGANPTAGMKTLIDMAKWRIKFIKWQLKAEQASLGNYNAPDPPLSDTVTSDFN